MAGRRWWWDRLGRRAPVPDPDPLAELEGVLAAVAEELEPQRRSLLEHRLRVLEARRVPLRVLRPAPVSGTVRLGFADGTSLLVRTGARGEALAVALVLRRQAVRVSQYWVDADGCAARLCWPDHTLQVQVLGVDQPD